MDSDPSMMINIIGIIASFLISAIFSCVKVIFYSIDNSSSSADDENFRLYSLQVDTIFKNKQLLSSTVSLGKSFSNSAFTLFLYLLITSLFPSIDLIGRLCYTAVISLIFLNLLGHEMPRALSFKYYRLFFNLVYIVYRMFSWLFYPFALLFTAIHKSILKALKYDEKLAFLSEDEKARISESDDTEALDEDEREMIRSIFDLGDTTVDEIMVPRIDIKGLAIESNLETVLQMVREEGHSRIPVYTETIDSIVGILYAKDIISWLSEHEASQWDLKQIIKKPHYVPVGKRVNDLMHEFKLKHIHFAIVVDEYGGTAGIVTMEDILEEIVGDIQDEHDEEEQEIVKIADNAYLVDPHVDIYDLNEELGLHLEFEDNDYTTLSGLIYHEYGDVPQENTIFDYENLKITVLKMDNQRIEKVKIEVMPNQIKQTESDSF